MQTQKKVKDKKFASAKQGKLTKLDNSDTKDRAFKDMYKGMLKGRYFSPERYSRLKIIKSGKFYEVYYYQIPIRYNYKTPPVKIRKYTKEEILEYERTSEERDKKNKSHSTNRARNNVKRLIMSNFDNRSKFITLTFRDTDKFDITDIKQCNKEFKKFIQRMRRAEEGFMYLAVVEFQKRGAIHYHMIADFPFIFNDELADIWRNGFVRINDISNVNHLGNYVTKYMTKDNRDPRLNGEKSYFRSRNLYKPIEYKGARAYEIYEWLATNFDTSYEKPYESKLNGTVKYSSYNLNGIINHQSV